MSVKNDQILSLSEFELSKICNSRSWIKQMSNVNGFSDYSQFYATATTSFNQLVESDWLEAFAGHPMIGDLTSLKQKFSQGKSLSVKEQSQVSEASTKTLQQLLDLNRKYFDKFGFIFIICASGKSADFMLSQLNNRLGNSREIELKTAKQEQIKISQIRMEAYR